VNACLANKLRSFAELSDQEQSALARSTAQRIRNLAAHTPIIEQDEKPSAFYVIQEGWACGYKLQPNGRRQIVGFFLPGDVCYLNMFILGSMDHSIGTITPVVLSEITQRGLEDMTAASPRLAQALQWDSLVNGAIQREWTVNVAQRAALERVAHLICELFLRLQRAGLTNDDSCEFPLTQTDIADALGLTGIHVNRMLQQLRSLQLIVLKERTLTIPSLGALERVAGFNPSYLQLGRQGRL
jgi:CRP-like cAMP-binding protein